MSAGGTPDIGATGVPAVAWGVVRLGAGRYRVSLVGGPDRAATLDVEAWDAPAVATVTPGRNGEVEIDFQRDGRPVDTRFSFRLQPPARAIGG